MDPGASQSPPLDPKSGKVPVVRGARACSVCRLAKMKCVGAEDGSTPCHRCKRTGQDCIFEKHKRGRKPGSKLSEASKMLRKLEKGLHNAKAKSQTTGNGVDSPDNRGASSEFDLTQSYDAKSLDRFGKPFSTPIPPREEDEDSEDKEFYPSKLIRTETNRTSFFSTILNPPHENPTTSQPRSTSQTLSNPVSDTMVDDVITLGILTLQEANKLFDLVFLRLNPFINLFDPALHTAAYVRSKSRFLFTTLMMAVCKFFEPKKYTQCQEVANDMAIKAFTYGWKSVEVCQAFACLTYYKEPDDKRTWTLIGYASRMAVELGLNRYIPHPSERENTLQRLERRNRERTYLVLFIHDRSLSTQTGRMWMLPECELVRNSMNWHEKSGTDFIRPEDVVVASFVQLRRIAAETTDLFSNPQAMVPGGSHSDFNFDLLLGNCNGKLSQWSQHWERELQRANPERFHFSFINLFKLYIQLFLNSFGLQAAMSPASAGRVNPSLQTLTACYQSGLQFLKILFKDFSQMSMLCYGQDTITVMSAYAAIFLLRLLRSPIALYEGADREFHEHISKAADAYEGAASISPAASSAQFHARFLRALLVNDKERAREGSESRPVLQESAMTSSYSPPYDPSQLANGQTFSPPPIGYQNVHRTIYDSANPGHIRGQHPSSISAVPVHASAPDQQYWRTMFGELGYEPIETRPVINGMTGYMNYSESQRYQTEQLYTAPGY